MRRLGAILYHQRAGIKANAMVVWQTPAKKINKAGNIKKDCYLRFIALTNLKNYVKDYSTKHKASFDITATTFDRSGKFSGADRRRFSHILIFGDEDTKAKNIDEHLWNNYKPNVESDLIKYWNNLREFSWNLKEDDFIWE